MKLLNIGFGSMVAAGRILAIVDPDSAPIKRVVQESRDRGMLVDASYGRKTKSVILMDTDHVILSALTPDVLSERWTEKEEDKVDMCEALREMMEDATNEGIQSERKAMAKRMLEEGSSSIEFIVQMTGLSVDEVQALSAENNV